MVTRESIINRLKHFGYPATQVDWEQIDFDLQKWINYTLNYCNITEVPEIVEPKLIDRVCAEFLYNKKNSGTMTNDEDGNVSVNYDAVIKSIKEGDTQITYAVGTDEATGEDRYNSFIKSLERGYDKWITPHRRLRW